MISGNQTTHRSRVGVRRRSTIGVVLALAVAVTSAVAAPHSADAAIKRSSKSSVASAYVTQYEPAMRTPVGWTGSVAGCQAGTESAASTRATLAAVNQVRGLAGLSPVALNPVYSAKAQQAALAFEANRSLSHDIPSSWACASARARQGARHSNIALGVSGAKAVSAYMDDAGASNKAVGHRRWLLNPSTKTIGTGSTNSANAIWVLGSQRTKGSYKNPAWVTWPSAGYFPAQLEPSGRWSVSGRQGVDYDFSKATVVVTTASGRRLPVKTYKAVEGYGSDTLVFRVAHLSKAAGTGVKKYSVTVTGVRKEGKKVSHSYTVRIFTPTGS